MPRRIKAVLKGGQTQYYYGVPKNTLGECMCCYQSNNIRNVCFSLGVYTVTSSKDPTVQIDSPSAQFQPPVRDPALCSILSNFRRNVTDLRLQLHQLKQMQVHREFKLRASALSIRVADFLICNPVLSVKLKKKTY